MLCSKFISNLDILDYLNGNSNNDEINFITSVKLIFQLMEFTQKKYMI